MNTQNTHESQIKQHNEQIKKQNQLNNHQCQQKQTHSRQQQLQPTIQQNQQQHKQQDKQQNKQQQIINQQFLVQKIQKRQQQQQQQPQQPQKQQQNQQQHQQQQQQPQPLIKPIQPQSQIHTRKSQLLINLKLKTYEHQQDDEQNHNHSHNHSHSHKAQQQQINGMNISNKAKQQNEEQNKQKIIDQFQQIKQEGMDNNKIMQSVLVQEEQKDNYQNVNKEQDKKENEEQKKQNNMSNQNKQQANNNNSNDNKNDKQNQKENQQTINNDKQVISKSQRKQQQVQQQKQQQKQLHKNQIDQSKGQQQINNNNNNKEQLQQQQHVDNKQQQVIVNKQQVLVEQQNGDLRANQNGNNIQIRDQRDKIVGNQHDNIVANDNEVHKARQQALIDNNQHLLINTNNQANQKQITKEDTKETKQQQINQNSIIDKQNIDMVKQQANQQQQLKQQNKQQIKSNNQLQQQQIKKAQIDKELHTIQVQKQQHHGQQVQQKHNQSNQVTYNKQPIQQHKQQSIKDEEEQSGQIVSNQIINNKQKQQSKQIQKQKQKQDLQENKLQYHYHQQQQLQQKNKQFTNNIQTNYNNILNSNQLNNQSQESNLLINQSKSNVQNRNHQLNKKQQIKSKTIQYLQPNHQSPSFRKDLPQKTKSEKKIQYLQHPADSYQKSQSPIKLVRNQQIHNLVVNMHKSQKNIKNIPLHRPNHFNGSKKSLTSNSGKPKPNLKRLDHNITLQRNVINLTVGQIFQKKHKKNDQMKQMLLKQIQELKQQIKLYEDQENQSRQINYAESYRPNNNENGEMFLNLNLNNYQQFYQHKQYQNQEINNQNYMNKGLAAQQNPLPNKSFRKNKYYTPRLPKSYRENELQSQNYHQQINSNFTDLKDQGNYTSPNKIYLFEDARLDHVLQGKINEATQGKIYSSNRIQKLQNSNITTQLKDSRFSKLMRQQDNSFNHNLSLQSPITNQNPNLITPFDQNYYNISKFDVSSPEKYLGAKIKNRNIGSIISYKEQRQKLKIQLKDDAVDAPNTDELQKIQEPDHYDKNIDFQNLKNIFWDEALQYLKTQLQNIKMNNLQQILPKGDDGQQNLVKFAHKVFLKFGINIQSGQILLNIKKYKNCILFCLNNQQNFIYHYDSKFYFGGWINNMKQKQGFQKNQKYIFKGQYVQNKKQGVGIIKMLKSQNQKDLNNLYDSKDQNYIYYYGYWQNNVRHGYGIQLEFTTNHVIEYKGFWQLSKKNGYGILSIYNKKDKKLIQKYQGNFVAGFKQGKGQQTFSNGDAYKGQYLKNKFHGKGEYIWSNGAIYRGDFEHGMRQGNGQWFSQESDNILGNSENSLIAVNDKNEPLKSSKIQYLKSDTYKGQYKNDKKNGFGIYIWRNGTIYEGQFMNDLKHGQGVIIYEGGKKIKYRWENGQILSQYKLQDQFQNNTKQMDLKQLDKNNNKFRRLSQADKKSYSRNQTNTQKRKAEQEKFVQFPMMNNFNSKDKQQKISVNKSLSNRKKMAVTMPFDLNKNIQKLKNRNYIKYRSGNESQQVANLNNGQNQNDSFVVFEDQRNKGMNGQIKGSGEERISRQKKYNNRSMAKNQSMDRKSRNNERIADNYQQQYSQNRISLKKMQYDESKVQKNKLINPIRFQNK